jgi:flavodoxin short chain
MNIAIVYWSATGNTQLMAEAIAEGARAAGADVRLLNVKDARVDDVLNSDVVALGSPAMGAEVIEESEMDPFVSGLERAGLAGKRVALFGSYDWGDGQWMRDWEDRMAKSGATLVVQSAIVHNTPDEAVRADLAELGKKIAVAG